MSKKYLEDQITVSENRVLELRKKEEGIQTLIEFWNERIDFLKKQLAKLK